MFEAVGTAQLIASEVHNVAGLQNAFRCTTRHSTGSFGTDNAFL